MHLSVQQEEFSKYYVQSIAACAGCNTSSLSQDTQSVDLTITGEPENFQNAQYENPQLDTQLKCTFAVHPRGEVIPFQLSAKNYNDLRKTNIIQPRILIVLLVPSEPHLWILHKRKNIILQNNAYWLSLRGYPELPIDQQSKIVHIPLSQRFTVNSLKNMLRIISNGGIL